MRRVAPLLLVLLAPAALLLPARASDADLDLPRAAPLESLEVLPGGARPEDELPLVVVLHGRGEHPESLRARFARLGLPARVLIPRPPSGDAWFRLGPERSLGSMARELSLVLPRIVATIEQARAARPTLGRPLLVGISQGAVASYALALRRPELFDRVLVVAGFVLPPLLLELPRPTASAPPPIVAFHGIEDEVVPIAADRLSVRALQRRGIAVELREYEGEGHAPGPSMQRELEQVIRASLPSGGTR